MSLNVVSNKPIIQKNSYSNDSSNKISYGDNWVSEYLIDNPYAQKKFLKKSKSSVLTTLAGVVGGMLWTFKAHKNAC